MPEMNVSQRRAVAFHDGALLLLAGPGSGKTTVLTHRIRELIGSGVKDSDILVITFTKAAALEMQERFLNLMAPLAPQVTFGTFHAIFFSILRSHRAYRKVSPITDKDKIRYMKRAFEMSDLNSEYADFDDVIKSLGLISACKNNGNDPRVFEQDMFDKDSFGKLFSSYNGLLKDFGLIDFDDMVNTCLEVLKNDHEFCELWQKRFKYILIDEFQDISGNQYELIKLLSYPEYNIFAVGDDDQSIYAFRGANVGLMRKLLEDIPGAVKDDLDVNYRSVKEIVDLAGVIIKDNTDRFPKKISAGCDVKGTDAVSILKCAGRDEQYSHILKIIHEAILKGIDYDDIAILTRTNRQGEEYAALLRSEGIICAYDDTRIPFSSSHIQDVCAYMSIASGDCLRSSYLRIINRPVRYIKREALSGERVDRDKLLEYYRSDQHMVGRIKDMYAKLDRIKNMSPYLALKFIRNTIGYDRYVKEEIPADKYAEYKEEMDAFGDLIKKLGSYRDVEDTLDAIRGNAKDKKDKPGIMHGVRVMTYHGSKGLEFNTVILPDVNENKIPSRSAHTPAAIEEERRMFYVAVTRAKRYLRILYRADDNLKPSRFIAKLKAR